MHTAQQTLQSIDWNFSNSPASTGIHSIHPYPAKFIPEIPYTLIKLFHPENALPVFDPFCGSGTALYVANELGLDAWGVDLHPIACLISRVKTTPIPFGFQSQINRVMIQAIHRMDDRGYQIPIIPRLDHWFKKEIQQALAALVEEINLEQEPDVRQALQLALSSIVVHVSNQESDTRYAAIEKQVTARDVFERFKLAASNISKLVSRQNDSLFQKRGKTTVINENTLTLSPDKLPTNIGLVITSPPYPNAYEYWLYHKYRMYWLGMDPIKVRELEIGARPHYFKKNHQDEHDFELQMSDCFRLLSQIMVPQAKACFVVGRSIIHGRTIDNAALLKRAAAPHGFEEIGIVERQILTTRKAFNPSNSKINNEHIVIFSLEGK